MLRECIGSVLSQTRPVQEVIVVNDGSTDDTDAVVKSFGSNIQLIAKANGGKASALNCGIAQSTSDYIWICDDDDIAAPDGAEHLASVLDIDDAIGFAYGTYRSFCDTAFGRSYSSPIWWAYDKEPNINIRFLEGMFTPLNAVMARRSLFMKTGPLSRGVNSIAGLRHGDRLSRGTKAVCVPKVIFSLREHNGMRGTAREPFAADKVLEKWPVYDRKILSRVREEFHLEEFAPTFALNWDSGLRNALPFFSEPAYSQDAPCGTRLSTICAMPQSWARLRRRSKNSSWLKGGFQGNLTRGRRSSGSNAHPLPDKRIWPRYYFCNVPSTGLARPFPVSKR